MLIIFDVFINYHNTNYALCNYVIVYLSIDVDSTLHFSVFIYNHKKFVTYKKAVAFNHLMNGTNRAKM